MSTDAISRRNFLGATALGALAVAGAGLAGCTTPAQEQATPQVKPVIMVVSFGTSYPSTRHVTIGAIESAIREKYPDYDVRRAFTAQTIIDILKERDGIVIDSVEEALDKCVNEGVTELIVQPTHLMDGFEYADIADSLEGYRDKIASISLGKPLLETDEDFKAVAEALKDDMARFDDGQTAMVLMGHGTEADSNADYATMQKMFDDLGYSQFFVGTVEASPTLEDTLAVVREAGFTKAVLRPFMVVAGDHANNDMADESDPDSWVSQFKAAGFEVACVLEGMGQIAAIDDIYVSHVQDAIDA